MELLTRAFFVDNAFVSFLYACVRLCVCFVYCSVKMLFEYYVNIQFHIFSFKLLFCFFSFLGSVCGNSVQAWRTVGIRGSHSVTQYIKMASFSVEILPALQDNYMYLVSI